MNDAEVQLWWLPVGAGGHVVIHTSRWWERFHALLERRPEQPLFHSALIVVRAREEHVIEMAPAWGQLSPTRGVAAQGPVGLHGWGGSHCSATRSAVGAGVPSLTAATPSAVR